MYQRLLPLIVLYVFLVVVLSLLYLDNQRKTLIRLSSERLESISRYKTNEIRNWIHERRNDAIVFGTTDIFPDKLAWLLQYPGNSERLEEVLHHFRPMVLFYGFEDVLLVDSAGRIYAAVNHSRDSLGPQSKAVLSRTFKERNFEFSDFYYCNNHKKKHIDFYAPLTKLVNGKELLLAMVLLRVDPAIYLYPLINSWPLPSKTSESLIVEKKGDSILFLSELRHIKGTTPITRPVNDPDLPAAIVLKGKEGIFDGIDYRGVRVLAFVQKIEGTPWYMITKTDRSEILESMKGYWFRTTVAALLMLLLGVLGIILTFSLRRKEALKNLYQLERDRHALAQHYELVLRNANDIILLSDHQGIIKDCNDKALAEYGYLRDELIGKSITMLITPAERLLYKERMEKLWQENSIIFETIHVRKNGSLVPVEVSVRSFLVGEQVHVQGIIRNISERKLVEQALYDSEKRYRHLFQSMTEGFALHEMLFDEAGNPADYIFLEINPSFEKLTGLNGQIITGKRVTEVFPTIDRSWIKRYGEVVITGEPVVFTNHSEEIGRTFKVVSFRPQPGQFAVIIEDISESIKKTELIQKMNEELELRVQQRTSDLEAANKELESFSYSVSHDLRTPLRSMDGFSLALLEDFGAILPAQAIDYLNRIRRASQRMGELIDELLKLSRINRLSLAVQQFDLSLMVGGICNDFKEIWNDSQYNISIDEGILVNADPGLFKIAITNLLHNAFKFSHKKPGPKITVKLVQRNNRKELMIQDNGAGFDMRYAEKIFSPFQRLHTTDEFPGTGIGLTIVGRIINRHGGVVSVESKPGAGTSFFIWIPGLDCFSSEN